MKLQIHPPAHIVHTLIVREAELKELARVQGTSSFRRTFCVTDNQLGAYESESGDIVVNEIEMSICL